MFFVDVILPLPLRQLYTYQINQDEALFLKEGMRVAVSFGKSKIYTAVVQKIHNQKPVYQTKEIEYILDEKPIITSLQLSLYQWVSNYYMTCQGEVLKMALPSAFLLESETMVERASQEIDTKQLTDNEFLVYEALGRASSLSTQEIGKIIHKKNPISVIKSLVEKKAIRLTEKIYEKYQPKLVKYIRLNAEYQSDDALKRMIESLSVRAIEQRKLILAFFSMQSHKIAQIKASDLLEKAQTSSSVLASLVKKNIFEEYYLQTDRVSFQQSEEKIFKLTENQSFVLDEINRYFQEKSVVLLHGVASSGKTEIYIKQIEKILSQGKQVLYLLPEIAVSVQLIQRLERFFGEKMSVYHTKYTINERVEVWNNLLANSPKTQLIIGVQSAVFLPFTNLGLIIVDEEHDVSYKQMENPPRLQARDTALVLAMQHKAQVLLGSATPSLESYYNTQIGKYGYVALRERYGNVLQPEIQLIDLKDKVKKKQMNGHFSDTLVEAITETLQAKKQVILFQNRRGYAPFLLCDTCGYIPQCPNCDVSLTYHQLQKHLRCHYCGYSQAVPQTCMACGSSHISMKGVGTEQVEEELNRIFPQARIDRMDQDTTKGKYGYEKIISKFENYETDILVGTQMVSKGLDFENVSLVGILNADLLIHQPDFRAVERSFQLLTQIAGRAGRHHHQGKVLIQTYNPYQSVLQQVANFQYDTMVKEQLHERKDFHYPPLYRLIRITFKHREELRINQASEWFAQSLRNGFNNSLVELLGPEFPSISRIRNEYIKHILVKFPQSISPSNIKKYILRVEQSFYSIATYRPVKISYNIDL